MRKLLTTSIAAITAVVFASFIVTSCGEKEPEQPTPSTVSVSGVSLNKTSLSLTEGGSETLTATVSPDNATNKAVSWKSSDTSVATVDNSGKVTAVKAGSATITVTTTDGSKTATCSVTVSAKAIPVTGITIDETSISIVAGESKKLEAKVAPDNATDKNVTWTSSDSAVATVDGSGYVTAVAAGSATITAKAGDKTATCAVTVTAKVVEIQSIKVDPESNTVKEGATFEVSVTFLPEGATTKPVSWRSTNDQVASVSGGVVTALKEGKTKIFARVEGTEIEAFCDLTVLPDDALKAIAFSSDRYEVTIGTPKLLEVVFTPSYAANKNVTFSSSNTSVATVASDGTITGLAEGETTITAKSEEGGFEASCVVVVSTAIKTGVYWTQNSYLMLNGDDLDIHTRFTPGMDPDGNIYYAHYLQNGKLGLSKNGVDIHSFNSNGLNDATKSAAGGGYFFIAVPTGYRKDLSVMRISDSGEEKSFSLHEGAKSYEFEIHDIAADAKGNVYVVGNVKDEYNLYVATMWTLTVGGKVSVTTFGDGSRDTDCHSVVTSGDDVWCLVWEGYSNIYNGKSILAAYKNAKRQYQVTDALDRRGGMFCGLGIAGNDVYSVVNEEVDDAGGNQVSMRIAVYKNGKSPYVLKQQDDLFLTSVFVAASGDVYASGYGSSGDDSFRYIWKNDNLIYSPTAVAYDLFVME